jgi:rRNA-processing protein FCF1
LLFVKTFIMEFLLDTSFLVSAMENKIDIVAELRKFGRPSLYVLDLVVKELENLSGGKGEDAASARLALSFLGKRGQVSVIRASKGNTDRKIIEYSLNRNMAVCTLDRELKESLARGGIEVITIRQGRYLVRAE